jgi:isopenicillin N synthase-like dioxygenase
LWKDAEGVDAVSVTESSTGLIPVLDLQSLVDGDPDGIRNLALKLRKALEEIGFFSIVNHGVPWGLVEDIYDATQILHALPQTEKDAITMDRTHGGYLGMGAGTSYASEIAGEIRKPNQNEAFFVHEGGYRESNQYPDLTGFKELTASYIHNMEGLANSLMTLLALSLDLDASFFAKDFDVPSVTLRMSHYPVMQYTDNEWGLAPHTDSSIFTLLPVNNTPGLEVRPAGYDWIHPSVIPCSFLVNSGDMLKRWTNGLYLSTAHRASNLSDVDRYAVPFFYGARDDALVDPVPTTVSESNPSRYEPITYGDYQRWFIDRNYRKMTGQTASETPP